MAQMVQLVHRVFKEIRVPLAQTVLTEQLVLKVPLAQMVLME
jgi:hypothetical protein